MLDTTYFISSPAFPLYTDVPITFDDLGNVVSETAYDAFTVSSVQAANGTFLVVLVLFFFFFLIEAFTKFKYYKKSKRDYKNAKRSSTFLSAVVSFTIGFAIFWITVAIGLNITVYCNQVFTGSFLRELHDTLLTAIVLSIYVINVLALIAYISQYDSSNSSEGGSGIFNIRYVLLIWLEEMRDYKKYLLTIKKSLNEQIA